MDRQNIALGVLGLSYIWARRVRSSHPPLHHRIATETELIVWNERLTHLISDVGKLVDGDVFEELISLIHDLRIADTTRRRTSSFHMNAISNAIDARLQKSIRRVGLTTEELRDLMYMEQDVIPLIRGQIENIIHNHMLSSLV